MKLCLRIVVCNKRKMSEKKTIDIQEFQDLLEIPDVAEFLLDKIHEAQERFGPQINSHRKQKEKVVNESESVVSAPDMIKGRNYFFEIQRQPNNSSGSRVEWRIIEFKLKDRQDLVNVIFTPFIEQIEEYEVLPSLIQKETVTAENLKSVFEISFMKGKDRVVGYVKEVERSQKKERKSERNPHLIKVSTRYENVDQEEMRDKIIQLINDDPDILEEMFFYFYAVPKKVK